MTDLRALKTAAVLLLLPGCATLVRGTKTNYAFSSTPPAAEVALSSGERCVTPCRIKVKRKKTFTASVSKPGYRTETVDVRSELAGGGVVVAAGNILAGGIVGAALDGDNGALRSFSPARLDVVLSPDEAETGLAAVQGSTLPD